MKTHRFWVGRLLLVLLAVSWFSAGVAHGGTTNFIGVRGPTAFIFVPSNIVINVGDTIIFTNQSSAIHDVVPGTLAGLTPNPYWALANLPATIGASAVTFSNAGAYPYICNRHVFTTPQPAPPAQPTQTGLVTVVTINLAPTATITTPSATTNILAPATFSVSASGTDPDGSVTNLQLYLGANRVAESASSPVTTTLSGLPGGNYVLTARVTDNAGLTRTSPPVNVVVRHRVDFFNFAYSPSALTIKPAESVFFTNIMVGSHTVSGTGVEQFCGSALVGIPSCLVTLNNPGTYPYQCMFHSTFGMTGTVTVNTFNRGPLARVDLPGNNTVLAAPASISIKATAIDPDGSVTNVQFFSGASLLGSSTNPPFALNLSGLSSGSYPLTVRAADNLGVISTSSVVNLTVVNPVPIELRSPAMGVDGFRFDFTANQGLRYVVERSTGDGTVVPFNVLTNVEAQSALVPIVDPVGPGGGTRLYRVLRQP